MRGGICTGKLDSRMTAAARYAQVQTLKCSSTSPSEDMPMNQIRSVLCQILPDVATQAESKLIQEKQSKIAYI